MTKALNSPTIKNNSTTIQKSGEHHSTIGSKVNLNNNGPTFEESGEFTPEPKNVKQLVVIICRIAALLHDIGKGSWGFQDNLKNAVLGHTPDKALVRHELYSSIICAEAFRFAFENSGKTLSATVSFLSTTTGLQSALNSAVDTITSEADVPNATLERILSRLQTQLKYDDCAFPAIFNAITWLTLTHHKLPNEKERESELIVGKLDTTPTIEFKHHLLGDKGQSITLIKKFITCDKDRQPWQPKRQNAWLKTLASDFADLKEVLSGNDFVSSEEIWALSQLYCRPALVFADYYGSSSSEVCPYGDPNGFLYANTRKVSGGYCFADTLEVHTLRVRKLVTKYCSFIGEERHSSLGYVHKKKRDNLLKLQEAGYGSAPDKFKWQFEASSVLQTVRATAKTPTISVVSAGTGHGKTIGMAGMALAQSECPRFTVALGRRGLSTQTYKEYVDELNLGQHVSLLIGGETLRYDNFNDTEDFEFNERGTDNLTSDLSCDNPTLFDTKNIELPEYLSELARTSKSLAMLASPICVMTIDHLTPSSDHSKSSNLTNLFRPMTSDLIVDEVDDYDLEQIGALSWLICLHGAYGRNVIIASATISPQLTSLLVNSFRRGVKIHSTYSGVANTDANVCFFTGTSGEYTLLTGSELYSKPEKFIDEKFTSIHEKLTTISQPQKKHSIGEIDASKISGNHIRTDFFGLITSSLKQLHEDNHFFINEKKVSFGLVKLNRTKDVVEYAKRLSEVDIVEGVRVRVVCYHSRFDSMTKMFIENWFTDHLNRKGVKSNNDQNLKKILNCNNIQSALNVDESDVCIVLVSTNIIEVGRDVDFDWGVYEPSGYQSLVQFLGRINRHRCFDVTKNNAMLLTNTLSELEGNAFCHFGVGSKIKTVRCDRTIGKLCKDTDRRVKGFAEKFLPKYKLLTSSIFTKTDIDNVTKLKLNTLGANTRSRLMFLDVVFTTLKTFSSENGSRALSSVYKEFEHIPMTRLWFDKNKLRKNSKKVSLEAVTTQVNRTIKWYFTSSKGKRELSCTTFEENTCEAEGWLMKETISEVIESINFGRSVTVPVKFNIDSNRMNSLKPINICARTGY